MFFVILKDIKSKFLFYTHQACLEAPEIFHSLINYDILSAVTCFSRAICLPAIFFIAIWLQPLSNLKLLSVPIFRSLLSTNLLMDILVMLQIRFSLNQYIRCNATAHTYCIQQSCAITLRKSFINNNREGEISACENFS